MRLEMQRRARVFVGTLFVDEAEFPESKKAIESQQNIDLVHHVIEKLPEKEAHDKLWHAWNEVKSDFELFVKVDADTVLIGQDALASIAALFGQSDDITGAQIPLHDYYTQKHILGLNCFSPEVVFSPSRDRLFCDRVDSNHKRVLRGKDVAHLAPIGFHGLAPRPEQAFYFGFHRALKNQTAILQDVATAFIERGGEGRMYALAGAKAAGPFARPGDYRSKHFRKKFSNTVATDDLNAKIQAFAWKILKQPLPK
jgi:hypothetical protein